MPHKQASELAPERVGELTRDLGLELSAVQCAALCTYGRLLQRWNRVHNLTAIDSEQELLTHHLLDSLAIVRPLEQLLFARGGATAPPRVLRFLDAGSGAGLPGIPIAVARPDWSGTLVDAVGKKCAFLRQAQLELGLRNVQVRHARLEQDAPQRHDLAVSRAFSSLRDFVELTRAHLRPGGLWAAMKGRIPANELAQLPTDIEVLDTITLRVPMLAGQRHLLVLRKSQPADAIPQSS